jgi:hypothetical protein
LEVKRVALGRGFSAETLGKAKWVILTLGKAKGAWQKGLIQTYKYPYK